MLQPNIALPTSWDFHHRKKYGSVMASLYNQL